MKTVTELAQQIADQELEACCEWVSKHVDHWPNGCDTEQELRTARRPKPPSLKKQALKVLFEADGADHPVPMLVLSPKDAAVIRRALEALPE